MARAEKRTASACLPAAQSRGRDYITRISTSPGGAHGIGPVLHPHRHGSRPRPVDRRRRAYRLRRWRALSGIQPERIVLVRRRPPQGRDLRHLARLWSQSRRRRSDGLRACLGIVGRRDQACGSDSASGVAGSRRRRGARARAHQRQTLCRYRSAGLGRLREEGEGAGRHERLCPRQGLARETSLLLARGRMAEHRDPARRRRILPRCPPARSHQCLGGGRGKRTAGSRKLRRRPPPAR